MSKADSFLQPIKFEGKYPSNWAGYYFREKLDYGAWLRVHGEHLGVDYNRGIYDLGDPVYAVANGVVKANGVSGTYGYRIVIEHKLTPELAKKVGADKIMTLYGHVQNSKVKNGQVVSKGQQICELGKAGTKAPHLHLEAYRIHNYSAVTSAVSKSYPADNLANLDANYFDPYWLIQNNLTPPAKATSDQRVVDKGGVHYRSLPNSQSPSIEIFTEGETINFKGWVYGQNVDGNNIWFVGKFTGKFSWSGGYTDRSTNGLADLNPQAPDKPPITPPVTPQPVDNALALNTVVNKKNPIQPLEYAPNVMAVIGSQRMETKAGERLIAMIAEAQKANVSLVPASGYRSYDTQVAVYQRWVAQDGQEVADTYSARAGHSEHQTGYTMDFGPIDDSFEQTDAYSWLTINARKFGFVLRYPKSKQTITGYVFEPWHWRYVGVDLATKISATPDQTLEEYFGVEGGLYPGQDPVEPETPEVPSGPDHGQENNTLLKQILAIVKAIFAKITSVFK